MSSNIDYKTIVIALVFSVILSTGIVMTVPQVQDALRGPQGEQGLQGIQGERGPIGPIYNDTREWHMAYTFREEEPWMRVLDTWEITDLDPITYMSDVFEIQGEELRLRWNAESAINNAWIFINVIHANGTLWAFRGSSGHSALSGEMRITEPGEYYLEVQTSWMASFSVYVWDYY